MVTTMNSKKKYLEKEKIINQSIINNSPVSNKIIDRLRDLYSLRGYSSATAHLFGDSNILVTELTVFQANMLITHADLLNTIIKEKKEKGITPKKNIKPYINIWNTLERRTR